jgi:hypothetical protein
MSEEFINTTDTEVDLPLDEDATFDGQDEFTDGEAVETEFEETQPEYFDPTDYANKTVILKVDGQEVAVPLSEALAGYQRQADYTRKTQELSKQREGVQVAEALQEALARDPMGTISLLQQHYGVSAQDVQAEEDDIWVDPLVKELNEIKAWKAELEYKNTLQQVEKEILTLEAKYGEDFNRDEVIARALASGSTDLEQTFKLIQFDKVYAERATAKKQVADTTKRTTAKKAAQVVSGGTSQKPSSSDASPPKSVFEAFEKASRDLGL